MHIVHTLLISSLPLSVSLWLVFQSKKPARDFSRAGGHKP
jgi:hypothetical protein